MQGLLKQFNQLVHKYRFQLCILSVASVVAYLYTTYLSPGTAGRIELHNLIVTGHAPSPYEYRVLVPYSLNLIIGPLSHIVDYQSAFVVIYNTYDWVMIAAFLLLCYTFLTKFHKKEVALLGTLFIAISMDLALKNHYYQPWTLLESVLFVSALMIIVSRKDSWLLPLLVIASINRESSLFIVVLYFLMRIELKDTLLLTIRSNKKTIYYASILFLCWLAIYLSLRIALGPAPAVITIEQVFAISTTFEGLKLTIINLALMFGAFWLFALLGLKKAPATIKRSIWIVPIYFIPNLVLGIWYEVRVLIPLLPIFVVIGLYYLCHQDDRMVSGEERTGSP